VDCLLRYYEYDTKDDKHPADVYVNADVRLDPDGKLLPTDCYMEICMVATRRSKHLTEQKEQRVIEFKMINNSRQQSMPSLDPILDEDVTVIASNNDGTPL